jgi:hypothetical protein
MVSSTHRPPLLLQPAHHEKNPVVCQPKPSEHDVEKVIDRLNEEGEDLATRVTRFKKLEGVRESVGTRKE